MVGFLPPTLSHRTRRGTLRLLVAAGLGVGVALLSARRSGATSLPEIWLWLQSCIYWLKSRDYLAFAVAKFVNRQNLLKSLYVDDGVGNIKLE